MTQEQLDNITAFAKGLLTPLEICEVMGLDYNTIKFDFSDVETPVGRAYKKGMLELRYELSIANIQFAKQGSSHAMNKVMDQLDRLMSINLNS